MGSTVTFNNLDFLDSRSVEQAVDILRTAHLHAKQSVELFGESEAEVRERLAHPRVFKISDPDAGAAVEDVGDDDGTDVSIPTQVQDFYRGRTKDFVDAMRARIEKHGFTTVGDTANDMGLAIDSARAFLRNAGRTNRAHGTEFPFVSRWNPDKGYNEYVAR